ncbi:hypothetical protein SAMN05216387_102193 [Nitrosovibrio tenuis]|uniref:Uncharacterized protein n=1 Tax=Nitrosovibrio tenuis TaxID=1233 RepID=A0A1H7IKX7_9PROT|nr:hypothetical protein SAMN05216387_102193 [Nitrosovibrio tenuis]
MTWSTALNANSFNINEEATLINGLGPPSLELDAICYRARFGRRSSHHWGAAGHINEILLLRPFWSVISR